MDNKDKTFTSSSYALINWVLLLSCTLIWGCSYYLIKQGLKGFEPVQVLSIRILSAAIALSPFLLSALRKIPKSSYKYIFLCAVLGNGIPIYLYPLAQTHISSSVAGIINSLTPLCTFMFGIAFYDLAFTKQKLVGVLLGLLGVLCLILFRPQASFEAEIFFVGVALLAPVLYGISNNVRKKHLSGLPGIELTTLMFFILALPTLPLFFYTEVPTRIAQSEAARHALPYLILLGVFGTAVAMSLINILLSRTHVMFASSVTYLMPLVALLLGVMDHERLDWYELLGFLLILVAVLTTNLSKS